MNDLWLKRMQRSFANLDAADQADCCRAYHEALARDLVKAGAEPALAHVGALGAGVGLLVEYGGLQVAIDILTDTLASLEETAGEESQQPAPQAVGHC